MKQTLFTLLLAISIMAGCSEFGAKKNSEDIDLKEISIDSKLSPREKADKMMEALNGIIRAVANEPDNTKASAALDSYLEKNSTELDKITQDFGDWSLKASQVELMDYIAGLQSKPFYTELDSNLTRVGYRMMESPELEKSMTKLLALINPPS